MKLDGLVELIESSMEHRLMDLCVAESFSSLSVDIGIYSFKRGFSACFSFNIADKNSDIDGDTETRILQYMGREDLIDKAKEYALMQHDLLRLREEHGRHLRAAECVYEGIKKLCSKLESHPMAKGDT